VAGNLVFVSGHGPLDANRRPAFAGLIGGNLTDSDVDAAAHLTTINLLSTLFHSLGTLNRISRAVEIRCFLVATRSSTAHLRVPRIVAELLADVFGPASIGCRTTIGVGGCVLDLPITIDLIMELGSP
jgi:enamine deaminase RidA (YjgF/YER057c/UK114 family)